MPFYGVAGEPNGLPPVAKFFLRIAGLLMLRLGTLRLLFCRWAVFPFMRTVHRICSDY